jgi:hypothetical protein
MQPNEVIEMKYPLIAAVAVSVAALSFGAAIAQDHKHDQKKSPAKGQARPTSTSHRTGSSPLNQNRNSPQRGTTTHTFPTHTSGNTSDSPWQNRPAQQQQQPIRTTGRTGSFGSPTHVGTRSHTHTHTTQVGNVFIQPNRNWAPHNDHRFNSSVFLNIDVSQPSTFLYAGQTRRWDPSVWTYRVDPALSASVYRTERMSNSMRQAFEQQMTDQDLRSEPGGQSAWDRVQRLDESLENLRSQTGLVSDQVLGNSALVVLSRARRVASSFNHHPDLHQLVQYQWDDLKFELNELAGYYGQPAIP